MNKIQQIVIVRLNGSRHLSIVRSREAKVGKLLVVQLPNYSIRNPR